MNPRILTFLILLAMVVSSALGVVYTRHEARREAVRLGELENVRDALIAEWSRLQLEQAWLADAGQVEARARDELSLREPEEAHGLVVKP